MSRQFETRPHSPQQFHFSPVNNPFQSRPFAVQTKPERSSPQQQENSEVNERQEKPKKMGHTLANISINPPQNSPPILLQHKLSIPQSNAMSVTPKLANQINFLNNQQLSQTQSIQPREIQSEEELLQMQPLSGVIQRGITKSSQLKRQRGVRISKKKFNTYRKKDIHASKIVKIFVKNNSHPTVKKIKILMLNQAKHYKTLDTDSLESSVIRQTNSELDLIQQQIKSHIKELTNDDASLQELQQWCINNPNDALTLQLKKMMQNMFADKKTSIPDKILPSTKYHTGEKNDPIPIMWYKPETEYKPLQPLDRRKDLKPIGFSKGGDVGGKQFGVDAKNLPSNWTKSNPIKKVLHQSDRGEQKKLNIHLLNNGYKIGESYKLDGDHVKDLGFDGVDEIQNYWPLKSDINRRAFHGYNENYVLNYYSVDNGKEVPKAKSIGGLIGKYFYVKGYLAAGTVPAESDTAKAGTDTP